MFRIELDLDPDMFDPKTADVKISSKENNALAIDSNGAIYIKSSTMEPGNARNVPGNSVAGTLDQSIDVIRLNQTVSRKMEGDPTAGNEGCMIQAFVAGRLSYLDNSPEEDSSDTNDDETEGDDTTS